MPHIELNLTGVRWFFRPPKTSIFEAFNHLNFNYDKFKKRFEQETVLRN